MPKTFLNISRQECLKCYEELLKNCERHFAAADHLAAKGEFGIAISLKVLGSEELVKALIIFLDGSGLRIRGVAGVEKFFKDHKTRHFISMFLVIMTTIIRPLFEIINLYKQKLTMHEPSSKVPKAKEVVIYTDNKIGIQSAEMCKEKMGATIAKSTEEQFEFWSNADDYKMKGFYVDFKESLVSPAQVTEAEYKLACDATQFFYRETLAIIEYVKNLSTEDRQLFANTINKDKTSYDTLKKLINSFKKDLFD